MKVDIKLQRRTFGAVGVGLCVGVLCYGVASRNGISKNTSAHNSSVANAAESLSGSLENKGARSTGAGAVMPEDLPGKSFEQVAQVRGQALKRLNTLWRQRGSASIVEEVLPLARHPLHSVRLPAVKLLGRLENPAALAVLQALNKSTPSTSDWLFEPEVRSLFPALPIAIGRIKARDLKGQEKVEAVLKEVGLTFPQLVALSARIAKDPYGSQKLGSRLVAEIFDVLYYQRKNGEDISSLAAQLSFDPGQKMLLQAPQDTEAEARVILDYLASSSGHGDEYLLIDYLIDMKPEAVKVAIDFAEEIDSHRQKYASPVYYFEVLVALAKQGHPNAEPVLVRFSQNKDPELRRWAAKFLRRLNM